MIEWLYGLQHFGIKLGLDNIRALLGLLGHPQRSFPSMLVAGTNGKGSVAAMVHAMLCASGLRAGLFTSPHLVRPEERIRIGLEDIGPDELRATLARVRQQIDGALARGEMEAHPSFFEVITATALEAFRQRRIEAAVLEVGLGGRLDATNAVDPAVSVVVSVDFDHVKTLGPTLEAIAMEKAGIVRRGRPVVSGVARQRAIRVLERTCRERGAPLIDARLAAWLAAEAGGRFTVETARARYADLESALAGRHQIDNARIALAAFEAFAEQQRLRPEAEAVATGLSSVRWPGRLQWLSGEDGAPDLLLDGAHNPAGAGTLARYLARSGRPRPVALFGAMRDKLIPRMLDPLSPLVADLIITRPGVERAADPADVEEAARSRFERIEVIPAVSAALARAQTVAGPDRYVLVTGSLYLVGEVLAQIGGRVAPGPVSF